MKTISIKILFAIILLATGISAHAENVITMVTSKSVGETIDLGIDAIGSYTVSGANSSGGSSIGIANSYKLTSDTVTITGDVINLVCYGDSLTALDVSHNTALKTLNCDNNKLTALDVSKNTALEYLYCPNNNLTSLDVSHNTALNSFDCSNNGLTALDVSKNTALKTLYCYGNSIGYAQMDTLVTSLVDRNGQDAGTFEVINTAGDNNKILVAQVNAAKAKNWNVLSSDGKHFAGINVNNAITMVTSKSVGDTIYLNITANGSYIVIGANNVRANYYKLTSGTVTITGDVTELDCASDSLTSLDVSMDTALVSLYCSENHLTSLDLSKNTKLALLYCDNNYISFSQMDKVVKALPDRNGKTYGQSEVINTAGDHNGISKDQVAIANAKNWDINTSDNKPYAGVNAITMVTARSVGVTISLGITASGSYTVSGANSAGGSSYTLTSQTVTITGDVTKLDCSWNGLSSLDVSHNTALDTLDCSNNDLTALDVSHNTALTMLECSKNRLTALDVSKNTALLNLECSSNNLSALDVSNNTSLDVFYCSGNNLTALEVSNNTALETLYCNGNSLTALDVSNNAALTELFCLNNRLTALDVSNNAVLKTLDCSSNSLTALYVNKNTALFGLYCSSNSLTTLDVSKNTALFGLYCYNNSIGYVQMDKLVTSLVNRMGKGAGTFKVINTAGDNNEISNDQAEAAKAKNWDVRSSDDNIFLGIYDKNEITMVTAKPIGDTIMLGLTGNHIIKGANSVGGNNYRLTSDSVLIIGDVTALDCRGDSLTSLDLRSTAKLTSLNCSNNKLATLNLGNNATLTSLDCSNNSLTTFDVSTDAPLINLDCSNNSLSALNVSNNTKLVTFNCSRNSLQSLDVSHNTALDSLNCSSNSLQSLDVSNNIALNSLNCSSNSLQSLDVSNDTALSKLACYGNSIGYVMMDTLVNSLADRTKENVGEFRVLNSAGDRNEITEAQVRAARAKNWNVLTADGKDYQGIKGIELTTRKAAGEYLQCVIKPSGASFVTVGATASATSVDSIFSCKLNSHNVTFIGNITRFECNDGALSRLTVNPAYNMDAVSCTNNYLRGSAMDALIASLTDRASSPSGGGPAVVYQRGRLIALQADVMLPGNASVENNIITKKQVAAAGEKGWDVYIRNSGQASDLTKYDGCDPVISLSGAKKAGSAITVKYTADGADSISGATGSDGTYTLTADTMRVAGLVTKLQCRGDSLSWINVSDNAALETLDCCDNAIAGKNMDALISSLPDRKYKTAGTLIAVDTAGDNNACTVVQVAAALARNWKVLAADGSPYQGTAGGINTVTLVTSRQVGKMIYLEIGSNGAYSLKGAAQMVIMGDVVPNCRLTSDTVTITGDITSLDCKGDELTSLELGNDTSLNKLNCNDNSLATLDLSRCAKLTELHCNGDSLTALDLSRNTALKSLECDSNRIDSLDLSHNKALTSVSCKNNRITALGLSGCAALDQLDCGNNRLDSLDLSGNTSLVLVDCRNNSIRDALMDTLVNSLVNRTGKAAGTFIVIDTDGDNNVCTAAQVDVARAKNWNVKSADGNDYGGSPRTGIEGITSDPNVTIVGIYDLRGIRLARLQPGFNIIKLSNGTAKKVFIKE